MIVSTRNAWLPKGGDPFSAARRVALRSIEWVPLGFAAVVLLGAALPPVILLPTLAVLAGAVLVVPTAVTFVVGVGGLLVSLTTAAEATSDLGLALPVVLAAYGGIVGTAVFIHTISDRFAWDAINRYLLAGVVAVELGLFTLSPVGDRLVDMEHRFVAPAVLAGVLLLVTVAFVRLDAGRDAMAAALLASLAIVASTGSPFGPTGLIAVVGPLLFALLVALPMPSPREPGVGDAVASEEPSRPALPAPTRRATPAAPAG